MNRSEIFWLVFVIALVAFFGAFAAGFLAGTDLGERRAEFDRTFKAISDGGRQ